MVIVTGCERSGTTVIAKELANDTGLPYVHEKYAQAESVMKHSLNMTQNLKHLELLDHLYPNAFWYWILRDGREVCRSIVQKIWQRKPHTMSLGEAVEQWNYTNRCIEKFLDGKQSINVIEYENYVKEPISKWQEYFTDEQIDFLTANLDLAEYGY